MAKKFKTLEEAQAAQTEAKAAVKKEKEVLTAYYTKNKLKRNEDYTDDAKHGSKIDRLQKNIDKASEVLEDINTQVTELSPKKGKAAKAETSRSMKYDYPADCTTAEQRKKFRIAARKEASGGEKKEKKEKPIGKSKKEEASVEETKTSTKKKSTSKVKEEAPKEEVKTSTTKKKKKVKKSADND